MPKPVPTCDLCKSRATRHAMSLLCDYCADMVKRITDIANGVYAGHSSDSRPLAQGAGK